MPSSSRCGRTRGSARLGLVDAGLLRELCRGPLPPGLGFGALDQTVACEVWLRSLETATTTVPS